jgi:hypothetical protein
MKPSGAPPASVFCFPTMSRGLELPAGDGMMIGKFYCLRHEKIEGNLCWEFIRPPNSVVRETDLLPSSYCNNSQQQLLP